MQVILAILIVMISLNGIKPFTVSDEWENSIDIYDFNWPADATSIGKVPKYKTDYSFYNAIVDILPYNFTEPFEKCKLIKFQGGSVKSIHINPRLDYISLRETSSENVIIKPDVFYKLGHFTCTKSKLTQIPENINRLKHLTYLNLDENLIETVQMDQFNGLNNLKKLFLSSNKIKHIYSDGPVSLPSLTEMYLDNNRLQHFDVCKWDMPTLSRLLLRRNNLTHFAIHQFPALKELLIGGNPLNCAWRDRLKNKSIRLFFHTYCDEKSVGDFVLDCSPPNHQLQQHQVSNFNSSLSQSEGTIPNSNQQVSELSDRIQKLEEQLKNLSNNQLISDLSTRIQNIEGQLNNLNKNRKNYQQVSERMQNIEGQLNILKNNQQVSDMSNRMQKIEDLLQNLTAKIIEQQNISNDIIEAMYRTEIERASKKTKKIP
ncbi:uncharacterized protein LOC109397661 [Aedes albopictus]|uniref:Uncharacterized protein n=1 Tax=Aedes albopictus TaxID=7160 RepID=A0ABM1Y8F7_AEDAL